jgi:hypothetical protein
MLSTEAHLVPRARKPSVFLVWPYIQVLVRVTARGKGFYQPAEDRFAVSDLKTEEVLEYVPAGPKPGYLPLACVNSPSLAA